MQYSIAPEIRRQRLLVEGYFSVNMSREAVAAYFDVITNGLSLRTYGQPIIFSPGNDGKEINQGYDAFLPLIDSGIALYVWTNAKFFSTLIYTCKSFSVDDAIRVCKDFFGVTEIYSHDF